MSELFHGIIEATASDRERAHECLRQLDTLPQGDLARPELCAAAQTFASLAIADALTSSGAGRSLADVVAIAGDVQP